MKVLLGFTVPEGEPFYIPIHHTVITGMTNLSGKTTTVEAILHRSKSKALIFLTKRGEKHFPDTHQIPPFYKERFDWEYVRGLLEASMHERLKFETPWIIRISKKAHSLKEVRLLLGRLLTERKLREFDRNIYTLLAAYLDKVLPTLTKAKHKFTDTLHLKEGINVMDLTEWYTNEEVQMLVIQSCMEHILKYENNVIVALPEAWKLLPQSRNTPVKLYFEKFIREGAANNNYLIIDAQDLGGVDKSPLRQVSVWIMGKMMEANEVQRLLKQTLGLKIKPEEVQTLPLGHFLVAYGREVQKVYVWPYGIPKTIAVDVAKGNLNPEFVRDMLLKPIDKPSASIPQPLLNRLTELDEKIETLNKRVDSLDKTLAQLLTQKRGITKLQNIQLQKTFYNIKVTQTQKRFTLTDETVQGKIMWLAKEGFLNTWRSQTEIEKELTRRAWTIPRISVYKALKALVKQGFIGQRKTDRMQFKIAPNVRFTNE